MKHSRSRTRQSLARSHLAELASVWGFRRFGPKSRRLRLPGARRAVATLVVLLLLAVTLALSYAMMRSQAMNLRIQQNASLRPAARQAALTGMTLAMRDMHRGDWAGIEQPVSGSLGPYARYEVTYTAGDASLTSQHEDFPYRVTLDATGYAADPSDPGRISTHQVRAVVRLVPLKLADEPSDWQRMEQYTVFQTKNDSFEIDIPCRLEGRVRVQGRLKLAPHYPNDGDAWRRYLGDLKQMQSDERPDYRPFEGPVDFPYLLQEWRYYLALESYLGVETVNAWVDEVGSDWIKPTSLTSYQIYRGGPVYTIRQLGTTLVENLEPDIETNPLGIYYRDGTITIRDNVKIRGSLFCRDDIYVAGIGVNFEPVELRSLYGESDGVRLPVASCRNFLVEPTGGGSLQGLLAVFDRFEIKKGRDTMAFAMTGRLITRKLFIKEREPWDTQNWSQLFNTYRDELDNPDTATAPYFPLWLQHEHGLSPGGGSSSEDGSGTAAISKDSPRATDAGCDIGGVAINAIDPDLVAIGARFIVSTADNNTVYTVTGRTPDMSSPTTNIQFKPNWGFPTPANNDTIMFLSDHMPRLIVKSDTPPARYHWKNRDDPIYVPRPEDEGLRWDLLEWTDNPDPNKEDEP